MNSFGPMKTLSAVALLLFCVQACMAKRHPRFNKREGEVICREECLHGFERVEGLAHCYKMLVDLGPVSQDKAVTACGYEEGATVVTFDKQGEEQVLRDHFWDKYQEEILASPAYLEDGGYWTGYVRFFGNVSNHYMNMYTGDPMDVDMFLSGQPDDRILGNRGGEACVCRKEFHKEALKWNGDQGLDDYTCAYPNWVICMQRNVYALNKEAWNSALMNGVQLPLDGTCELDWVNQNFYQLTMMKDKRLAAGRPKAQQLADSYMEILNTGAIQSPTCPQ